MDQFCDIHRVYAGASGNANHSGEILVQSHAFLAVQLLIVHRIHDCQKAADPLHALLLVAFGHVRRAHSRNHRHHLSQRPELPHVLQLLVHVSECELPLCQARLQLWLLVQWHNLIDSVDKAGNITQPAEARHERLRIELLEVLEMLACAYENDRRMRCCNCRQSTTTFRVAVQLCNYHTPNFHGVCKSFCLIEARLSDVRIHHENNIIRLHNLFHLLHFLEQRCLLLMPTTRVNNNDVVLFRSKHLHSFGRNADRIAFRVATIKGDTAFSCILLELVKCSSAECVCTNKSDFPSLALIICSILSACSRLSRTLQTDKHDDVRLPFLQFQRFLRRCQQARQFLAHTFLYKFSAIGARTHCFIQFQLILDSTSHLRYIFDVDISLQESLRNVL
mmetsp:Transcript_74412/g.116407  ORF Transcript_74412/g.116407 Transcript_74412/m.116407 type:complete len:392 (+) Transcript_74412:381-1556(+)